MNIKRILTNCVKSKVYLVGGAVRDALLNIPAQDRDYVVTGVTPDQMISCGFTGVGADFPVFLGEDNEEYALARTERKTGKGYLEFNFDINDITIEQDLMRRDLTVNAMAMECDTDILIDPYGGASDLNAGILRHVSIAFAEDPLRTLRVARFAARYDFTVADETMKMMNTLVGKDEYTAISKERVWTELSKAMTEPHPALFFAVLHDCGAISEFFPHIDNDYLQHFAYLALSQFNFTDLDIPVIIASTGLTEKTLKLIKAPSQVITFVRGIRQWQYSTTPQHTAIVILNGFNGLGLFNNTNHNRWYRQFLLCHTEIKDQCIEMLNAAQSVKFADLPEIVREYNDGNAVGAAMTEMRRREITKVILSYN